MRKKIAFVFVEDYPDWESAEALYFITILGGEKYEVQAVGITKDPVRSISGVRLIPDCSLEEIVGKFDGLILVGGIGWTNHMSERIAAVQPVVEDAIARGCLVGGVGTGVDVIGAFGLLNHAIHTGNSSSEIHLVSDLGHAPAPYAGDDFFVEEGAIRNGNIITARNTSGLAFARAFVWAMEADQEKADAMYEEHKMGAMLPVLDGDGEFEKMVVPI